MEEKSLTIQGYQGRAIANRFFQQPEPPRGLAVVLPGFGYHAGLPLLFYPTRIAMKAGLDLLRVDYAYNTEAAWDQVSKEERGRWLHDDVNAALDAGLGQRDYAEVILIGKSIGTRAMALLLDRHDRLPASRWVWLTPLLTDPILCDAVRVHRPRSLFAIGSGDDVYDEQALDDLLKVTGGSAVVVPQANHSLEVPGGIHPTLQALDRVMTAVEEFILAPK